MIWCGVKTLSDTSITASLASSTDTLHPLQGPLWIGDSKPVTKPATGEFKCTTMSSSVIFGIAYYRNGKQYGAMVNPVFADITDGWTDAQRRSWRKNGIAQL